MPAKQNNAALCHLCICLCHLSGQRIHSQTAALAIVLSRSRPVYFHALSSTKEFVVSNRVLRDEALATREENYYDYQLLGDRGNGTQSTAEVYDPRTRVLFYTLLNQDAIGCWHTRMPYAAVNQGVVAEDHKRLLFANELKIDAHGYLWVLSNRMPRFLYTSLNSNDCNFRLLRGNTARIIQGTPCAV